MKLAGLMVLAGLVPALVWVPGAGRGGKAETESTAAPEVDVRPAGPEAPGDTERPRVVDSETTAWEDSAQEGDRPVYVVYYWRARPGHEAEYSAYVRDYAEPIDEEARRAGVFEEVHTYTPFLRTGAPGADWTHMRVFKLKNFAALDGFSAGLDAATNRLYPDRSQRPSSAEMRDLVRQEIWRDF